MSDADTSPVRVLLELQRIDTTIAQLHHRRATLPERSELQQVREAGVRLDAETAPVRAQQAELEARQNALEHEISLVETKIADADRRLFSGATTISRELQALQADIASLKRRRSELEDAELEIMMAREPIDAEVVRSVQLAESLGADEQRLIAGVAAAEADVDTAARGAAAERTEQVAAVSADLLALYEKIRTKNNGVGVARLEHGTCMACRLKLSAVELDRLRHQPAEAIVRCEECGAILVR